MEIYKLNYLDKETAIADLIAKGVYTENLTYRIGIQAIVEIGKVVLEHETETAPTIFAEGYAYDIMSENKIEFESEITVKNPKHSFAGY